MPLCISQKYVSIIQRLHSHVDTRHHFHLAFMAKTLSVTDLKLCLRTVFGYGKSIDSSMNYVHVARDIIR